MATVTLTPGLTYTPPKCDLCEAKTNPHPAQLSVSRNGTADTTPYVLCPRCDTALAKLAAILGPAPSTFQVITSPTSGHVQSRMDFDSEPPATDAPAHCSRCGVAIHTDRERERTTCDDCDGRGPDDDGDDDGDDGPGDDDDPPPPPPTPGGDDTTDEPAWMRIPALPNAGATDLLALPPPQPAKEPVSLPRRRRGRGHGPDAE